MAHGYRTLQHWNQWLSQKFLGSCLLEAEDKLISNLLANHYGKHAVLIGVPQQIQLLKSTLVPRHSLISPLISKDLTNGQIEGDFHELPILSGSVDLVMLPHTLELIDNPRQLLAEACRIIKPEGLIVIAGFNPCSAWGLRRMFARSRITPWTSNFMHSTKVKSWLRLADFEMEQQRTTLFTPPFSHKKAFNKLHFLERIGSLLCPVLGGAYVLVARAKIIPLTPIKLKWKQQLGDIRISSTISGHIARQERTE